MSKRILAELGIEDVNAGACYGMEGWIEPADGRRLVSYNPTTGEPLAAVIQADETAYVEVVDRAKRRFLDWRMTPAPKRGQLIRDLGNALRQYQEPLGDLVSLEMGKIRSEGHGEVQEMIDICDFAVGMSRQLYGVTTHSERARHRMYEQWHPLGVTGVISAFNFPVAVWSWNAAITSICGNTTVWKPSSTTPLTAVAVQHICNQVTADHRLDGLFNLLIGPGRLIGERLISDERIPLISFTGSTAMGRHVAKTVAGRLARSILELGGNNAIIVTPNANLDMAVRASLFGAVGTAGQRCTSTRRLIAHRSIFDPLARRLTNAYQRIRIGDPLEPGVLMGPLVDEPAVEAMMAAIEQAKSEGGIVLTGGNRLPNLGPTFVEPTLIRMPAQSDVVKQETFAPILYLLEYDSLDEALAIHNDVPQGLSSAIFTNNMVEAETFLSPVGSDCGIANVNLGTSGAEISLAFGGEKETGGGRESGSDAWKGYMRRQSNTLNWCECFELAQGIEFQ